LLRLNASNLALVGGNTEAREIARSAQRAEVIDITIYHGPPDSGRNRGLCHLRETGACRMTNYSVRSVRGGRLDALEYLLALVDRIAIGVDYIDVDAEALGGMVGNARLLTLVLVVIADERYEDFPLLHR
jgi:hypothetical protein